MSKTAELARRAEEKIPTHIHSMGEPCGPICPGFETSAAFYPSGPQRLVGGDRNSPGAFTDGLRADELGKAAKKMDFGKPPVVQGFLQYFARAILAVAYVSEYGARKYAQPGKPLYSAAWQEVSDGEGRYADADGRHRVKIGWEGDYDEESDLAHLAHKAWNALAELEIALKTKRIDCRIGNVIVNGKPQPGTSKKVPL